MSNFEIGKVVVGKVTGIEKYGIFINVDDEYTGLIHISEISDGFVKNVEDFAKIGESIKTKIIDIDQKTKHMKLSIKNVENLSNKNYKKSSSKMLTEIGAGFKPLSDNLDNWIQEKNNELDKKR